MHGDVSKIRVVRLGEQPISFLFNLPAYARGNFDFARALWSTLFPDWTSEGWNRRQITDFCYYRAPEKATFPHKHRGRSAGPFPPMKSSRAWHCCIPRANEGRELRSDGCADVPALKDFSTMFLSGRCNHGDWSFMSRTLTKSELSAPRNDTPAIRARGVTKRFGDSVAIQELDLDVESGECVGLLGPNGAGKSTFIGCLYGVVLRSGGDPEGLWSRSRSRGRVESNNALVSCRRKTLSTRS